MAASDSGGRLGNQMGEYAMLYGLSRRLGVDSYMSKKRAGKLMKWFR